MTGAWPDAVAVERMCEALYPHVPVGLIPAARAALATVPDPTAALARAERAEAELGALRASLADTGPEPWAANVRLNTEVARLRVQLAYIARSPRSQMRSNAAAALVPGATTIEPVSQDPATQAQVTDILALRNAENDTALARAERAEAENKRLREAGGRLAAACELDLEWGGASVDRWLRDWYQAAALVPGAA